MNKKTKYASINEKLNGLYLHLLVFFVINFSLFLLNLLLYPYSLWFYFPLLMWGTAIIIHFFALFVRRDEEWNERTLLEAIKHGTF
ncbi:MAG: 2TM domain-containing protein [Candidatus Cloacimonadota bacterium]|nr:MAG: 2TM domain-containing protein [Candidatus Cloacimonadota bacterium]